MKKVPGYVISLVGALLLASNLKFVKEYLPFVEGIDKIYLLIGGAVLLILGILILRGGKKKSKSKESAEVPIYHGDKIVGYRRS